MLRYPHPVTPTECVGVLRDLCGQLVSDGEPLYVEVRPTPGAPPDDCFPTVDAHVQANGGMARYGWSLWELPSVFVEAEFHAVWQSPSGGLLDVSSKKWDAARILFLPDPRRAYEGRQVNNLRRSLSIDPAVGEYLGTFDAEFEVMNRGDRAFQHGMLHLSEMESLEMARIMQSRQRLHHEVLSLAQVVGPYTPCLCGSGKKTKWCHPSR